MCKIKVIVNITNMGHGEQRLEDGWWIGFMTDGLE